MGYARLRIAYRIMQLALIGICLVIGFTWYNDRQHAQYVEQSMSKKRELLATAEQVLGDARKQRDMFKGQLEAAQGRLTAAEARQAAAKQRQ